MKVNKEIAKEELRELVAKFVGNRGQVYTLYESIVQCVDLTPSICGIARAGKVEDGIEKLTYLSLRPAV